MGLAVEDAKRSPGSAPRRPYGVACAIRFQPYSQHEHFLHPTYGARRFMTPSALRPPRLIHKAPKAITALFFWQMHGASDGKSLHYASLLDITHASDPRKRRADRVVDLGGQIEAYTVAPAVFRPQSLFAVSATAPTAFAEDLPAPQG